MLEILTHSSFWHAIWWDSFLCESDTDFLFSRGLSKTCIWIVYMKFSSQFPQQLLITDAWKFNTLFLLVCHKVGFIFVWIQYRLSVFPCVCPKNVFELCIWNFRRSFLSNYSSQMLESLTHSSFWHAIRWDSFLCESNTDFLFFRVSVQRMYLNCVYEIFVAVSSATTHHRCLKFYHTLPFGMPYNGIHFCVNPIPTSCLSVHLSIESIWNFRRSFFSIADAWNFSTLFILTCHMVGFIFSRIW
jgi:hypothetical protein